jgi:hypothetical protein
MVANINKTTKLVRNRRLPWRPINKAVARWWRPRFDDGYEDRRRTQVAKKGGDKMDPIDNSIGLNSGGVYEDEIRALLEKYANADSNYGFTHLALLSPGGGAIIVGPDVGDCKEQIEEMIGDPQFITHMNSLFDLQAKINERAHKAGAILEVVIMCKELTFALNLFGRKNVAQDKYFITEVVIPIVATRAYLGAHVQSNSAKVIADLRKLVEKKRKK